MRTKLRLFCDTSIIRNLFGQMERTFSKICSFQLSKDEFVNKAQIIFQQAEQAKLDALKLEQFEKCDYKRRQLKKICIRFFNNKISPLNFFRYLKLLLQNLSLWKAI
jgi:hypothetical protein